MKGHSWDITYIVTGTGREQYEDKERGPLRRCSASWGPSHGAYIAWGHCVGTLMQIVALGFQAENYLTAFGP